MYPHIGSDTLTAMLSRDPNDLERISSRNLSDYNVSSFINGERGLVRAYKDMISILIRNIHTLEHIKEFLNVKLFFLEIVNNEKVEIK